MQNLPDKRKNRIFEYIEVLQSFGPGSLEAAEFKARYRGDPEFQVLVDGAERLVKSKGQILALLNRDGVEEPSRKVS
jgi:hypothetical protein